MSQQRIDAFMADIKAVCEKHGMRFNNPYDERIDILDENGDLAATEINVETFEAESYTEPKPREYTGSTGPAMKLEQAAKAIANIYAKEIQNVLREPPSPAFRKLFKGGD